MDYFDKIVAMGIDLSRFKAGKQSQEWLDWLRDEPLPSKSTPQTRQTTQRSSNYLRPSARISAELSGRGVVPGVASQNRDKTGFMQTARMKTQAFLQWTVLYARNGWKQYPRQIVSVAIITVVGTLGIAGYVLYDQRDKTTDQPAVLSESTTKPDFEYTLPEGDQSSVEGAVKFDPQRKVVNYKDTVAGVAVTVSQQKMPDSFKDDSQEKVKKIAADFSATRALTTATPTAYIGDSIEGPQTVIFTKNDLLIFILSANKLDDKDWAEYVTKLK